MNHVKSEIEANVDDDRLCSHIVELVEVCILKKIVYSVIFRIMNLIY